MLGSLFQFSSAMEIGVPKNALGFFILMGFNKVLFCSKMTSSSQNEHHKIRKIALF